MEELEQIREQNRWKPERQQTEEDEPKNSLPKGTIALMISTALFFDAIQVILLFFAVGVVLNTFINIFAGLTFFLWFMMHGISFLSPKRLAGIGGGFIVELIPILNSLPAWTGAVWYIISTTKILQTVEKLPGGKVAGFVAQSTMATTNASRAQAISNTSAGQTVRLAGGKTYTGTKKFESIDTMSNQPKLSPQQQKISDVRKAYTGWKTQMTDIDKMRSKNRKYSDSEYKPTDKESVELEDEKGDYEKAV